MKRILFISWKDILNPASGGAEVVHQELSKRLVSDGYEVVHLVPGFKGGRTKEKVDGVEIIRIGSSVLSFYFLPLYYFFALRKPEDIVIDAFNCFGSFTWVVSKKSFVFIHHVQGQIWWWQNHFNGVPDWFVRILNPIGYVVEKLQLIITGLFFRGITITVSESTKSELINYGLKGDRITVIPECAIESVKPSISKKAPGEKPKFVHMMMRKMKRPLHAIQAFQKIRTRYPKASLTMLSGGGEIETLKQYVQTMKIPNITFTGRVSEAEKLKYLGEADVLIATPVKEGWGLIVTEANSQGTPAVTYDVPGLRDSNKFGALSDQNPESLAKAVISFLSDSTHYQEAQIQSWNYAKNFTFDNSYQEFRKTILE